MVGWRVNGQWRVTVQEEREMGSGMKPRSAACAQLSGTATEELHAGPSARRSGVPSAEMKRTHSRIRKGERISKAPLPQRASRNLKAAVTSQNWNHFSKAGKPLPKLEG